MKNFQHFSDLDAYFCQLFTDGNTPLAHIHYKGQPIGVALQHNLYEYIRSMVQGGEHNGSFLHAKLSMLRILGIDHKLKLLLNKVIGPEYSLSLANKIIFFADNFVPRILQDFLKIISGMNGNEVAFCTTDYRAYRYMSARLKPKHVGCVLLHYRNTKRVGKKVRPNLLQDVKQPLRLWLDEDFAGEAKQMERIIRSNLSMLAQYFDLFEEHFKSDKPRCIVLGSDGFSVARVCCLAAANCAVPTYVLQHGLLDSLNGYLPLVADKIMLWSEKEKQVLLKRGVDPDRLLVTGAPRFDIASLPQKRATAQKQILFVLSPSAPQEVYKQMDGAFELYRMVADDFTLIIRPHPYFKLIAEAYFKSLPQMPGIVLDSAPFLQSIVDSELVVFANISTGVYEAQSVGKDAFIIDDGQGSKMDLYQLPKITAARLAEGLNKNYGSLNYYNVSRTECAMLSQSATAVAQIAECLRQERKTLLPA